MYSIPAFYRASCDPSPSSLVFKLWLFVQHSTDWICTERKLFTRPNAFPYFNQNLLPLIVLHNSFPQVKHLVDIVVRRIGLEIGYRFKADARKVKFVVKGPLPPNDAFPKFNDFEIVHHYLQVLNPKTYTILRTCICNIGCMKELPRKC